jgi:hypothetical protein
MLVRLVVLVGVVVSASARAGASTTAAHVNDSSSNRNLLISALPLGASGRLVSGAVTAAPGPRLRSLKL